MSLFYIHLLSKASVCGVIIGEDYSAGLSHAERDRHADKINSHTHIALGLLYY